MQPNDKNGWVHTFELDTIGLDIINFQNINVLSWLAELMKHRDADKSRRYSLLSKKFIKKYGIETNHCDVIVGYRANASYFYIAKAFVRDEIDIDLLENLLSLGGLGIQYCIKSQKAYLQHVENENKLISVEYNQYNEKYNQRDVNARMKMKELINSDKNKLNNVFSDLIRGDE